SNTAPLVTVLNGERVFSTDPTQKANLTNNDILARFFAYTPTFLGGVNVAAGDLNGDGKAEIVTGAGPGGGPHVRIFSLAPGAPSTGDVSNFVQVASNAKIQSEFFAYAPNFFR